MFAAVWPVALGTLLIACVHPKPTTETESSAIASNPVEEEYLKLLAQDDDAQTDADRWIREAGAFDSAGAGGSRETLIARIDARFDQIRKDYNRFLERHPNHARARLAFGSFLNETRDESGAVTQWERALEIDPTNPAAWNNLANHYGHRGPVKKAFEYYERAIELDPGEATYLQNLATTTYLFRKDAREHYGITEQEVFDRALELYRRAMALDPENFPLATDYAQTFYGIRPLRTEEALHAWNQALKLAHDQIERDGIHLHIARIQLLSGDLEQARSHLGIVTNQMYQTLKERLTRNLQEKATNSIPTGVPGTATN
jgi:tetratricopeptide (TPR) repeat protein